MADPIVKQKDGDVTTLTLNRKNGMKRVSAGLGYGAFGGSKNSYIPV